MPDRRLLVLDDDADVADTVALVARSHGFDVRTTASPDEFFEWVESWSPSHVAVDLLMPAMDGIEILRALASAHCSSRVIVMSGVGAKILEVKRQTPAWVAKLHQEGWDVHTFSIAEQIWTLLKDDPFWSLCVMEDKSAPLDWPRTNKALADILTADNGLLKRLEEALQPLEGQQNALLLVTDLEALHPFLRIGAIESQLQGKFHVPTIFLYPGVRTGKTRLKFLGFYPEDGNYRSVHVGG